MSTGSQHSAIFHGGAFKTAWRYFVNISLELAIQCYPFGVNEDGPVSRKAGCADDNGCKSGVGIGDSSPYSAVHTRTRYRETCVRSPVWPL